MRQFIEFEHSSPVRYTKIFFDRLLGLGALMSRIKQAFTSNQPSSYLATVSHWKNFENIAVFLSPCVYLVKYENHGNIKLFNIQRFHVH